jgi:hypothetical protein
MIRAKKGDNLPKKYDFVQGRLTHDEEGVLAKLTAAERGKLEFRLLLLTKVSNDEYVAVFEYEEPNEMPDSYVVSHRRT